MTTALLCLLLAQTATEAQSLPRVIIEAATFDGYPIEFVSPLLETVVYEQVAATRQYQIVPTSQVARLKGRMGTIEDAPLPLSYRVARELEATKIIFPHIRRFPEYAKSGRIDGPIRIELTLADSRAEFEVANGLGSSTISRSEALTGVLGATVRQALSELNSRTLPEAVIFKQEDPRDMTWRLSKGSNDGYKEGQEGFACRGMETLGRGRLIKVEKTFSIYQPYRLLKGLKPGDTVAIINTGTHPAASGP